MTEELIQIVIEIAIFVLRIIAAGMADDLPGGLG